MRASPPKRLRASPLLGVLIVCLLLLADAGFPKPGGEPIPPKEQVRTHKPLAASAAADSKAGGGESSFAVIVEQVRQSSLADFDKMLKRLPVYGQVDHTRNIYARCHTNRQKEIKIEVEVRSSAYQATFITGPMDASGKPIKPLQPDGNLLSEFHWIYPGSRRGLEAITDLYRSTGHWPEQEAITETYRLMERMGMKTNQFVPYGDEARTITVQDPSGKSVRVTPFHTVEMHRGPDDEYGYLRVEYRVDEQPPGRVIAWVIWPPMKVP